MRRLLIALTATAALIAIATASDAAAPVPAVVGTSLVAPQPGGFVAQWMSGGTLQLEELSQQDGTPLGVVASLPQYPVTVSGPYRATDGALWVTVMSGPRYGGHVAGGDPRPNTCGGSVVRLDPRTAGAGQVELTTPSSGLIASAVPSPDDREIVFDAGGCTSYFDSHLVVRNLKTGTQWTIGAGAARCHGLSAAQWSADGSRLVFSYAPAQAASGPPGLAGTCTGPRAGELAIVPAGHPRPVPAASQLTRAQPGCQYTSAAFDRAGVAAIETCGGSTDAYLGPAYLIQLDRGLHRTQRLALLPGADPATVTSDPQSGQVLVTEYEAPQPPAVQPTNHVWTYDGTRLRLIRTYLLADGSPAHATL